MAGPTRQPPAFPRSLPEFIRLFPDEGACLEFLRGLRWPEGFRCSACDHREALARLARRALQCARCDHVVYATAGTVMHRSKQPLSVWLTAAFLLVTAKRGISAAQVQRALGLRYETAFQILHKLRAAMVAPHRELLRGRVDVDETYVGGPRPGPRGRGALGKMIVLGAVEKHGQRPGRLRLRQVQNTTGATLTRFIQESIEPGSTVVTDANSAYNRVAGLGYHHRIESTARGDDPDDVLPGLHLAFSNLKTWLKGTFHGAAGAKHLQAYLNEFVFRFNRRTNLQAAFHRLLGLGLGTGGPTYAGLYGGQWKHPGQTGLAPP